MNKKINFNNKNILITGGTGSFGNKFVETILKRYKPNRLIIFSRDELKQYDMSQKFNLSCMRYFIGDIRDKERLNDAMSGVDYVIHAAAMKQVPASEYNPMECIKTNIYGAENVIRSALNNNVQKVIALSTDKAAGPINLYGATKLASDKLFVSANNFTGTKRTIFSVVRYGNVVGSRGSVIPFFKKIINEKAKFLPITHPEMTRFWITLEQGVDFVIKNFIRMQGGEIFIPKIPSILITDLAKAMSSKTPIKIIGIRPGEKLHETMFTRDDSHLTIEFNDHYVIKPSMTNVVNKLNYKINMCKEKGKDLPYGEEYNSNKNDHYLNQKEIKDLIGY